MKFLEMTSPRLQAVDRENTLLVLPIAAVEQHGPHMPTGTDTIICGAVAEEVERQVADSVLLLPTVWLGASSHHLRFGATTTATLETYIQTLCEIVEPLLEDGYCRLMLLNGHGGNIDPMRIVLRELQPSFPHALLTAASYWAIAEDAIAQRMEGECKSVGHACEAETSLVMHLRPELVDMEELADQSGWLPDQVQGMFICRDMHQRTKEGATGRPDLASPEKGADMFGAIVSEVVSGVKTVLAEPLPDRQ